ncbi:c-type cytochrome [Flavobacterium sp.]
MKKIFILLTVLVMISCKKEEKVTTEQPIRETAEKISGQDLFEGKGNCVACHQPSQKVIGPSLEEISKIYKAKNASIVSFLKEESEPIVDPSQYEVMKTNFIITKAMSDQELSAIEEYIHTFSK